MSNDFVLVDPKAWEYDLHSIYSAYIGYFQVYNIPWYERSWGHFFDSFDEFLAFSWPVITVTDSWTGRAHIVTRLTAINSFIKMIKTRFGETLPQAPNILQVNPFETSQRRQRHVSDYVTYSRLHATLPAAHLAAVRTRVRSGEPKVIRELWEKRDKTFLAIDFEWNERNEHTVLEWGYAALRCGHLDALGHWPPSPDTNYRKGHYIVAEYVDKIVNKYSPTYPWQYAFGESQVIPKGKLPQIIQTIISSLASPDSETAPNTLVLVAHGLQGDLSRLEEMKIKLPGNMLMIDTSILERSMYNSGHRGVIMDPKTEKPRLNGTTLSLEHLLISLTLPPINAPPPPSTPDSHGGSGGGTGTSTPSPQPHQQQHPVGNQHQHHQPQPHHPIVLPKCALHNAGNDAFMTLFALQHLLEPSSSRTPTTSLSSTTLKKQQQMQQMQMQMQMQMQQGMQFTGTSSKMMVPPMPALNPMMTGMSGMSGMQPPSLNLGMQMPMGSPSMRPSMMLPPFPGFGMPPPMGSTPNGLVSPIPNGGGGGGLAVPNGGTNGRLSASMGQLRPKSAAYDLAGEFGNLMSEQRPTNGAGAQSSSLSKATGNGLNRPRYTSSPNLKNGK